MAHSNMGDVRYFRRPWYWLVVLALVAISVSILVVVSARAQYAQNVREFEASRDLREQRVEQRIDEFFMESVEIASFGEGTLDDSRGNVPLTRELAVAMLHSRHHHEIIGVGAFFAPYQFDPHYRLMGIYEYAGTPGHAGGEQFFERNVTAAAKDYTGFSWYERAIAHPGQTIFAGPYTHVRSFITTARAFSAGGRVVGVVVVDTLTAEFKALMASALASSDVAWIESSRNNGHDLVATASIPPGARVDRRIRLRYTGAFLHLSTDATPLQQAAQNELSSVIGLLAAVWLVTALIAIGMVQRWAAQERQRRLEAERKHLEDEIALSKTVEAELRKAAYADPLTGLPNRAAFLEFVQSIIGSGAGERYAVFFIDLDRFNIINETLGHMAGDELLRATGKRLESVVESTDLVARLGGDEFVIVASIESRSFAEAASLLLAHLSEPILLSGRTIYPEASMGVVAIDASYTLPEDLLRDADIAMYAAKNRGRAQFAIFDAAMRQRIAEDSQLEHDLRRAIEHGELLPYYQPIVSMATRKIVAFEALARWHRQDGRIVTASEFMHFAETRGFIEAIDTLVFRSVCADAKSILSFFPGAVISVNVSAAELTSQILAQTVEPLLQQYGLHPSRLKLEITETAMMTSSETTLNAMERLRQLGLEFVLDDFGTGYSSLAYLQRLPITGIKIDRSFVEPLPDDPKAVEIVRSIVALARSFGLSTTAEGVETGAQCELLTSLGVDHAQGFFFSPAVELEALTRLDRIAL
jgi:diguanylate cyclase (GGDEF)-like protein